MKKDAFPPARFIWHFQENIATAALLHFGCGIFLK